MKCRFFFPFLLMIFLLMACKKEETFSTIPYIEFVSLEKLPEDSAMDATLTLYFHDGDGDIGLNSTDVNPPYDTGSVYHYNFFIDYYEKQYGKFVKVETPLSNNARIPRLSDSESESIEGNIVLDLYADNPYSQFDTIRFECYIVDRALHHSNKITTSELVFKK